jgi:hypothetical protein
LAAHVVGSVILPHGSGVMQTPAGQLAPAGQAAPMSSHAQPFCVSAAQSSGRACDEHESLTTAAGSCAFGLTLPHAAARHASEARTRRGNLLLMRMLIARSRPRPEMRQISVGRRVPPSRVANF